MNFKNIYTFILTSSLIFSSCISPLSKNPMESPSKKEAEKPKENIVKDEIIEIEKQPEKEETNKKNGEKELVYQEHEKRITALESKINKLNFQVNDLSQDNNISKKIISLLRNDVNSLNEIVATNKKEIEIIKRGLRSGIFEDQAFDKESPTKQGATMLPNLNEGRDIYTDKTSVGVIPLQSSTTNFKEPEGPAQLIADAELKLRQAQYGEAIISLDKVKKNYPNYDDKGKSLILSSEAWLRLGEYNNVFNDLRTFYIKYPENPDLSHAKLLEAETYEKLNSKSKAAQLYQEVISLSPQSTDAQSARDGMLRMRDSK